MLAQMPLDSVLLDVQYLGFAKTGVKKCCWARLI